MNDLFTIPKIKFKLIFRCYNGKFIFIETLIIDKHDAAIKSQQKYFKILLISSLIFNPSINFGVLNFTSIIDTTHAHFGVYFMFCWAFSAKLTIIGQSCATWNL